MSRTVQEECHVAVAALVSLRAQVCQDVLSHLAVVLARGVAVKLQQGGSHHARRRGIFVLNALRTLVGGEVHVPERYHVVARLAQPLQVDVRHLLCEVEEPAVTGVAVDHRVAVNRPCLSAAPHRMVGIALVGHAAQETAGEGVVDCHMIARAVGTEVVVHGRLGMAHRYVVEPFAVGIVGGCLLTRPEEQLQVDHVVHDGVVSAVVFHVTGPRENRPHLRIEQRGELPGGLQSQRPVVRVGCLLVPFQQRIDDDESQVVVIDWLRHDGLDGIRILLSRSFHRLVVRMGVVHPKDSRPETRTPLFGNGFPQVPLRLPLQDVAGHHAEVVRL